MFRCGLRVAIVGRLLSTKVCKRTRDTCWRENFKVLGEIGFLFLFLIIIIIIYEK
jgi:hypothetical protein